MFLTRHLTGHGARWALDGHFLAPSARLSMLLELDAANLAPALAGLVTGEPAVGPLLAPVEHDTEVWASGVTFLRSREARMHESEVQDVYEKVYDAERVEVFFKSPGWRVVGTGQAVRVRRDSSWNVPEPELAVVANAAGAIVGYCVGNDVSSRDIEGENPLYLPQAKIYNGSCALGPGIVVAGPDEMRNLPIRLEIERDGQTVFTGATDTGQLKRSLEEIVSWLYRELDFPQGTVLLTGTGVVPPDEFSLGAGDRVRITIADRVLDNPVES